MRSRKICFVLSFFQKPARRDEKCPLCPHRDNHDEDKPALNSIADNTVAMEVT